MFFYFLFLDLNMLCCNIYYQKALLNGGKFKLFTFVNKTLLHTIVLNTNVR